MTAAFARAGNHAFRRDRTPEANRSARSCGSEWAADAWPRRRGRLLRNRDPRLWARNRHGKRPPLIRHRPDELSQPGARRHPAGGSRAGSPRPRRLARRRGASSSGVCFAMRPTLRVRTYRCGVGQPCRRETLRRFEAGARRSIRGAGDQPAIADRDAAASGAQAGKPVCPKRALAGAATKKARRAAGPREMWCTGTGVGTMIPAPASRIRSRAARGRGSGTRRPTSWCGRGRRR
jgi:hypothetical protein